MAKTPILMFAMSAMFAALAATAEERPVELKSGLGLEQVKANCSGCHSLDYIEMNSPFLSPATWEAEVAKMINAFGAPIGPDDAKLIAAYLAKNYGN